MSEHPELDRAFRESTEQLRSDLAQSLERISDFGECMALDPDLQAEPKRRLWEQAWDALGLLGVDRGFDRGALRSVLVLTTLTCWAIGALLLVIGFVTR